MGIAQSARASTRTTLANRKDANRLDTKETASATMATTMQAVHTMAATVVTALCKTIKTPSRRTSATSARASTQAPRNELEENRIASNCLLLLFIEMVVTKPTSL